MEDALSNAMHDLHTQLHDYPWYAGKILQCPVSKNAVIAYVHKTNLEILTTVPDKINDFYVKIHFIGSAPVEKKTEEALAEEYSPAGIRQKIQNLINLCSRDVLTHILYEVLDGDDAVTDYSSEYPVIRSSLDTMANHIGTDVLYDYVFY